MDSAIIAQTDPSPVSGLSFIFSTMNGKPILTKQYPRDNAESISINTVVYGIFNQECTDTGLSVKLVDEQNTVNEIDSIVWNELQNSFILYPHMLEHNSKYTIIIADSSVVNPQQEYNDSITWSFYTAKEAQPVVQTLYPQLETSLCSDSLLHLSFSDDIRLSDTTGIIIYNDEDTLKPLLTDKKNNTITIEIPGLKKNTAYTFQVNDSAVTTSGMNWISGNGIDWEAAGKGIEQHYHDLCIRAYSDTSGNPVALFSSNKQKVCPQDTVVISDFSSGNITGYTWKFGADAVPSTATTKGPHKVVYQSKGLKSISLIVDDGTNPDTLNKFNYVSVTDDIHVYIPEDEKEIPVGKSDTLNVFGADTYKWFPTFGLDTSRGDKVVLTPLKRGDYVYYVYGTQGNCSNMDSIIIHATKRPVNDDVCNADTISPGLNGPYTNVNASVEINEPHPPTPYSPTDPSQGCNTQTTWCKEYNYETLANSIWFTFTAPASGKVSLGTKAPSSDTEKEFDTQIALYKAKTCQDILSGNYTLIAANDDHFGWQHQFAAGIELIDTLTPGATYWLQLDGSARGEEGECYITYSEYMLNIQELENNENEGMKLFPNPCHGTFNIIVPKLLNVPLSLTILDMKGSTVHHSVVSSKSHLNNIQVHDLSSGTYIVAIKSKHHIYHRLLIIN
jgi:PKD repeat protein